MPLEKRCPTSQARLFIPTVREQTLVNSQRLLDQKLSEVDKLKQDLEKLLKEHKK